MLYPQDRSSEWMNELDTSSYERFLERNFHAGAPISFESVSWNRMIRDHQITPQRAYDQLTAPGAWSEYRTDPAAQAFKEDLERILESPAPPRRVQNSGIRSALGSVAHGVLVGAAAIAAALGGVYFSYRAHNAESMPIPPVQETYVQNTIMVEPGDSIYGTVERYLEAQNPGMPDEAIDRAVALVALENGRMPPQVFDDLYPEHAYPDGAFLDQVLVDAENINPHQPGPISIESLDDFTEVEYIGIEHPTTIMIEPGDSLSGTVERYLESRDPNISENEIDRAVARVAVENGRLPPEVFDAAYPEHSYPDGTYLKPVFRDGENINPHLFGPGPINVDSLDELTEREYLLVPESLASDMLLIEPGDSLSGTVERYLESRDPNISDDAIDRAVALVAVENARMPPEAFNEAYPEHTYPSGDYLEPVFVNGENINPHLFQPGRISTGSLDELIDREVREYLWGDRSALATPPDEQNPFLTGGEDADGFDPLSTPADSDPRLVVPNASADDFRTASYALYAGALGLSVAALLAAFGRYGDRTRPSRPPTGGDPQPTVWGRARPSGIIYPSDAQEAPSPGTRSVVSAPSGVPLESRVNSPVDHGLENHVREARVVAPIATDYVASVLDVSNGKPNQELYGAARHGVLRKARILSALEQGLDASYSEDRAEQVVASLSGEQVSSRTARNYIKQLADEGHTGALAYRSASGPKRPTRPTAKRRRPSKPTERARALHHA